MTRRLFVSGGDLKDVAPRALAGEQVIATAVPATTRTSARLPSTSETVSVTATPRCAAWPRIHGENVWGLRGLRQVCQLCGNCFYRLDLCGRDFLSVRFGEKQFGKIGSQTCRFGSSKLHG